MFLIEHEANQGVGGAIISGYKWASKYQFDVTVVMAGDGQMDPGDLDDIVHPVCRLIQPIIQRETGCSYGDAWDMMPHYRYLG